MDADMTKSFGCSLPVAPDSDTFYQIHPNFYSSRFSTSISGPQFQDPLHIPRQDTLSPEKERKSDRIMKGVIGLNFRPGVDIGNGDKNLTSAPSASASSNHFYGFYWTCCNKIAEKATVLGSMRGMMESAVKGLCKKKNLLAENKCGECGHLVFRDCEKVAECLSTMQVLQEGRFECSRRHLHKVAEAYDIYCIRSCPDHCGCYQHTSESGRKIQQLARRERKVFEREMKVSEREVKVSEEEDRLADMSKYLEGRNSVISLREGSLERAEEELERRKNELLASRSWSEQIEDWAANTSNCAQDGSSYGSYGRKARSDSNGSLQASNALDSRERLRCRRSSHSDRPMRPHDAPNHPRRSSSASHHYRQDSHQPAIRITPPDPNIQSIPGDWGNRYEY
ncbi:uncharacterized protein Bfra_005768 [Botrytis fragariae]|uniref:Uncharacterized protein n=1 Tax=Botrytis fragariae TaxID=1964551 RepID=A0A8H6ARQ3_9HELO|nr:uncharacterized protein Bfra_005768 [Botrytis fragariae]KAF5872409.1 hypothetical protein Bfra_005768 [Botrytis fragariae]